MYAFVLPASGPSSLGVHRPSPGAPNSHRNLLRRPGSCISRPVMTTASSAPRPLSKGLASSNPENLAVEHMNVPAAHRDLHETLYPSSAEAEHGSASEVESKSFEDGEGRQVRDVAGFLRMAESLQSKIAGVYGVFNSKDELVYVGLSRNVALNIRSHLSAFGCETVASVRVRTFVFPRRSEMERARDAWITEEDGSRPLGNASSEAEQIWQRSLTSAVSGDGTAMSLMTPSEKAAFEDKKFKLRKAMADPTLVDELEASDRIAGSIGLDSSQRDAMALNQRSEVYDALGRSQRLREAVEQQDWSEEINAQTSEAISHEIPTDDALFSSSDSGGSTPDANIVSPFLNVSGEELRTSPASSQGKQLAVTVDSVDIVLNEVRPYLVSDGGNISVVAVVHPEESAGQGATVKLLLEGACGTCPSSTMTMKLGVERVLRERFGKAVGEIVAVNGSSSGTDGRISIEACDAILDEVRPILSGLSNCSVVTKSVVGGNIVLEYNGPKSLSYAIEHMLKEKLPGVASVTF